MGFLQKILGSKTKDTDTENKKLFELLERYHKQDGQGDSYKNVALELINGNSFLLLPSINNSPSNGTWTTTSKDQTLKLTSIFNLDGLKVLGAFTDEDALSKWAKKPSQYTMLSSKDVLKICEENLIDRIVINSDLPTMFVLERNRENIKTHIIEKDTTVQVGTPNEQLDKKVLKKLIEQFEKIDTIEEVYQYGQTKDNELSIVLGFKLSTNSENAKKAAINSVQTALNDEKLEQLLDVFFIEDNHWLQTVRNIEDSFVYKK